MLVGLWMKCNNMQDPEPILSQAYERIKYIVTDSIATEAMPKNKLNTAMSTQLCVRMHEVARVCRVT